MTHPPSPPGNGPHPARPEGPRRAGKGPRNPGKPPPPARPQPAWGSQASGTHSGRVENATVPAAGPRGAAGPYRRLKGEMPGWGRRDPTGDPLRLSPTPARARRCRRRRRRHGHRHLAKWRRRDDGSALMAAAALRPLAGGGYAPGGSYWLRPIGGVASVGCPSHPGCARGVCGGAIGGYMERCRGP